MGYGFPLHKTRNDYVEFARSKWRVWGIYTQAIVDKVEIVWPSGQKETLSNLPGDSIYTVVEGEGVRQRSQLERNKMQTP